MALQGRRSNASTSEKLSKKDFRYKIIRENVDIDFDDGSIRGIKVDKRRLKSTVRGLVGETSNNKIDIPIGNIIFQELHNNLALRPSDWTPTIRARFNLLQAPAQTQRPGGQGGSSGGQGPGGQGPGGSSGGQGGSSGGQGGSSGGQGGSSGGPVPLTPLTSTTGQGTVPPTPQGISRSNITLPIPRKRKTSQHKHQ